MKKINKYLIFLLIPIVLLTGCSSKEFIKDSKITVISREDGSGTKDTFTKLFRILDDSGIDNTTIDSDIIQSTGAILSSVESNKYAIGYVSYGSLNSKVKSIAIDGISPTKENIKNGMYKVSRTFNIVVNKNNNKEVVKDFINFILSSEGQQVVENTKYISKGNNGTFKSIYPQGKISISGSSSVSPVIEKLKEKYQEINKAADIEINQSDSTNGIENTIQEVSDIGMTSRDLTTKEKDSNINNIDIALDALVVIVSNDNPINNLTQDEIKNIYQGNIKNWKDIVN